MSKKRIKAPLSSVEVFDSYGNKICMNLSKILTLGPQKADSITLALVKFCVSYSSTSSAKKLRTLLKSMGDFYALRPANLDEPKSLYAFLFDFRAHWFTSDCNSQRLDVRNGNWDVFVKFFKFLISERVFIDVTIPGGNPKLHKKDILSKSQLNYVYNSNKISSDTVKSLIPISLARSDDEYLVELEEQFIKSRDIFLKCAKKEIDDIENGLNEGDNAIKDVDYQLLKQQISSSMKSKPYCVSINRMASNNKSIKLNTKIHLFRRHHPDGYKNILARIHHEHDGYFPSLNNYGKKCSDPALRYLHDTIPSARILTSHLGLLTGRRAIPIFVYLLLKNPKFNVEALANIEVEGRNGINQFLSTGGEESNSIRVKVRKGRAKAEKSELLDEESKNIIKLLIRLTEPLRIYLRKIGDPSFNKLWLATTTVRNPIPHHITPELMRRHFNKNINNNPLKRSDVDPPFMQTHIELSPYADYANLARLRTTAGLIEWFKSGGDAKAVARALGNTVKVSIDHYIPKQLQILMNRRIIRRFQTLLIATATAGEEFILEATCFTTLEELHRFLSQMIDKDTGGNALLSELQRRNGQQVNGDRSTFNVKLNNNEVAIQISSENLALLFLYEEYVNNFEATVVDNSYSDIATNTTPRFWAELSCLLRTTIPKDSARRELLAIYNSALTRMVELRNRVTFPPIARFKEVAIS